MHPTSQKLEGLPLKQRAAAGAFLSTITRDARRLANGMVWAEISVEYLVRSANRVFSWSTAQSVLAEVESTLHVGAVDRRVVRGLGGHVRLFDPRAPWGRHYLLTAEAYDRLVALERVYGVPVIARTAADFVALRVKREHQHKVVAYCPFHDDRHPSVALMVNADGQSASGVCFACEGRRGPLRLFAVRARDGWVVKKSKFEGHTKSTDQTTSTTFGTIYSKHPTSPQPVRPLPNESTYALDRGLLRYMTRVRGVLRGTDEHGHNYGLEQRSTESTSLVRMLTHADRMTNQDYLAERAQRDSWALVGGDPRQFVADRLIGLDYMRPTHHYTTKSGRRFATKWASAGVSHVLVDIDRLAHVPAGSAWVDALRDRLVDITAQHDRLNGEIAVVRTSETGMHVVFGLATLQRPDWHQDPRIRAFCRALGDAVLAAMHDVGCYGGVVDPSTFAAQKYVRAPGPRIAKDGKFYVARLLFTCAGRGNVEKRKRVRRNRQVSTTLP